MLAAAIASLVLAQPASAQETAPPPEDATLAAAHERLTARDDLQFERPRPEIVEPAPETRNRPIRGPRISPFTGFLEAIGPLARILFWTVIGVAVLAFVIFAVRRWLARDRSIGDDDSMPAPVSVTLAPDRPDARTARTRLEEADALAAAGRFDEAVRLLLHSSHADLETARKASLARSMTAREITSLAELSARARAALSPITALVERALFAGRALDTQDYTTARAAYQDFAFGMPGSPGAGMLTQAVTA
jgi:hypothetical protein